MHLGHLKLFPSSQRNEYLYKIMLLEDLDYGFDFCLIFIESNISRKIEQCLLDCLRLFLTPVRNISALKKNC